MRTLTWITLSAVVLLAIPAHADYTTLDDAVRDETAVLPFLHAPYPAAILVCEDPSVDIMSVRTDAYYEYYIQAWINVRDFGPRQCSEQTHARHNEYRVYYEPDGALLGTDDALELRATYTDLPSPSWHTCAVIHFADGMDSNCFANWYGGGLTWGMYQSGNAPVGDWNGYRAYDLRHETYQMHAKAWSVVDGEPSAPRIVDFTSNQTVSMIG